MLCLRVSDAREWVMYCKIIVAWVSAVASHCTVLCFGFFVRTLFSDVAVGFRLKVLNSFAASCFALHRQKSSYHSNYSQHFTRRDKQVRGYPPRVPRVSNLVIQGSLNWRSSTSVPPSRDALFISTIRFTHNYAIYLTTAIISHVERNTYANKTNPRLPRTSDLSIQTVSHHPSGFVFPAQAHTRRSLFICDSLNAILNPGGMIPGHCQTPCTRPQNASKWYAQIPPPECGFAMTKWSATTHQSVGVLAVHLFSNTR